MTLIPSPDRHPARSAASGRSFLFSYRGVLVWASVLGLRVVNYIRGGKACARKERDLRFKKRVSTTKKALRSPVCETHGSQARSVPGSGSQGCQGRLRSLMLVLCRMDRCSQRGGRRRTRERKTHVEAARIANPLILNQQQSDGKHLSVNDFRVP